MRALALRGQHLLRGGAVLPPALLDFDFTQGVMPAGATFTRSGTATAHDSTGKLVTLADGVPRFDYDPSTLAPRGIQVEGESRQNIAFPSTNWLSARSASSTQDGVIQNAATAPDGSQTAMAYVAGTFSSQVHQLFRGFPGSVSTTYSRSIWVKAFGCTGVYLSLENTAFGGNAASVSVDLTTGAITGQSAGSGYAARVVPYPNGWYRVTVTATTSADIRRVTSEATRSSGQSHHRRSRRARIFFFGNRYRITRAGFPATIAYGGTDFATTALAPTTAPSPIVTPDRINEPYPSQTSFPMTTSPPSRGMPCHGMSGRPSLNAAERIGGYPVSSVVATKQNDHLFRDRTVFSNQEPA